MTTVADKTSTIISAQVLQRSLFVNGGLGSLKLLSNGSPGTTLILQIVGVICDILFVQKYFTRDGKELVPVPYDDLSNRLKSFMDKSVMSKAVVAIAISYIVTDVLTDEAMRIVRRLYWVNRVPEVYVDVAVTVITNAVTGWLFLNLLKFRWAYVHNSDINTNFLVVSWFSVITVLHVMRYTLRDLKTSCSEPTKTRRA